MPDPANVATMAQKRREAAMATNRSGRQSTILSDYGGQKLGG